MTGINNFAAIRLFSAVTVLLVILSLTVGLAGCRAGKPADGGNSAMSPTQKSLIAARKQKQDNE